MGRKKRDEAVLAECKKQKVKPEDCWKKLEGVPNRSADKIPRVNVTWSDCNLENNYEGWEEEIKWDRLQCRNCEGLLFEVLSTGGYETSARCHKCGFYYVAHCG
jgi:hypothetical protein